MHVKLYLSQMGKIIYVFLTLQRTPSMKRPSRSFFSQEKDKCANRFTTRHTSYLYLIIGKKMKPVQSLKCQLFYVLPIPRPNDP